MTIAAPSLPGGFAGIIFNPEKAFAVAALLALSGAFFPLLIGYENPKEKAAADPLIIQAILISLYMVAVALLLWMKVISKASLRLPTPLILLLGYALLSTAWSIDAGLTLKRFIPLLGTTLIGLYIGTRFTLEGLIRLLFFACVVMLGTSLVVYFVLPRYGVQPGQAAWAGLRGAFANKNTLGSVATHAIFTAIWLSLPNAYNLSRFLHFQRGGVR